MEFDENTTYVLTATRTRATWKEPIGNSSAMQTKSIRFRRGDKLEGIPVEQVAHLVQLGHAVPESEWDPDAFRKMSAHRRMMMQQAAADNATTASTPVTQAYGQPVVGLEDAAPKSTGEERTVDGIKVQDVLDLKDGDGTSDDDAADLGSTGEPQDRYTDMPFPDLVQEAKAKTGNGGGGKEELKARLREHDANQ